MEDEVKDDWKAEALYAPLLERLRWVVRLRFGVVAGLVVLVLLGRFVTGLPIALAPVVALAAVVFGYNLALSYALSRPGTAGETVAPSLVSAAKLGGTLDLLGLVVLVCLTGGTYSPWLYFPIIPLVVSAVMLPPWHSVRLVATGAVLMAGVLVLQRVGWVGAPSAFVLTVQSDPRFAALEVANLIFVMLALAYAMAFLASDERRTDELLQRVADDRQRLLELTRELSVSLDPKQVLQTVAKRGAELVGCEMVGINLIDPETQGARVVAFHSVGELQMGEALAEVARGSWAEVGDLQAQPIVHLPDPNFPQLARYLDLFGSKAAMLVRIERAPLPGWVGFGSRTAGHFDTRQVALAQGIARYAAIALANAELYNTLRDSNTVTSTLVEIGRRIGATLDVQEVTSLVAEAARDTLGSEWALSYLWDDEQQIFQVAACAGLSREREEEVRSVQLGPGSTPLVDRMLEQGGLEELPDASRQDLFSTALLTRWGVASALIAGVRRGDRPIGFVVTGFSRRRVSFTETQRSLLRGIVGQAAAALENARLHEVAQAASRLKSDFVATMSHELRSPLNVIIGYGDLLLEGAFGELNEQQKDVLEASGRKALQLLELINTTLDLNRLDAGRDAVERVWFSLRSLCLEVESEVEGVLPRKKVQIEIRVPPSFPRLYTDRSKLKLIVKNLVSNALKFTAEGSVGVAAAIEDTGEVAIRVSDTGRGISAQDLPVIFDMFRQGSGEGSHTSGGVGLGLHIAKRLVGRLGGTIRVDSAVGVGSTFEIRLPASVVSADIEQRRAAAGPS